MKQTWSVREGDEYDNDEGDARQLARGNGSWRLSGKGSAPICSALCRTSARICLPPPGPRTQTRA